MTKDFDVWQTNMLVTGNVLGAEIASRTPSYRAFLYIRGYRKDGRRVLPLSKIINADHSDALFSLRVFEISAEDSRRMEGKSYFEHDLEFTEDIPSIGELRKHVSAHLDDFSLLKDYAKLGN